MSVVSPEDIRTIPLRYNIGKRPLSLLLGWGELTYTRLLDGNTPTPQHAAELRRLLDDPAAFARLLETGRGRITDAAYNRSMRAVDALLADEGGAVQATRIFAAADRLCLLAQGDLTPSALQRLAYFAQGYCFALLDEPLFNDLPRATPLGPAYDRIYDAYTAEEIQRAATRAWTATGESSAAMLIGLDEGAIASLPFESDILTRAEVSAIDQAYLRYGQFSGQTLSQLSRETAPWRKARKRADAQAGQDCDEHITAKSMRKYFSKQLG